MAVTADQLIAVRANAVRVKGSVAASTTLYAGAACFVDSGGDRTNTTNTGANAFGGFVVDQLDNSSGADGDVEGEFWIDGHVTIDQNGAGLTKANLDADIYMSDNYTVTTTSTNNVLVGKLVEVLANDKITLDLGVR